ncbi:2-Hydroxyacid oxidase 1-like isoform X2 [Apostichopus japonicus]|uniref:2-Hydroxyacid oxidase 1-like isoform X2 n=1 Tax=Stichopus japonicus TaxID=307972 RepID=UPI003AB58F41
MTLLGFIIAVESTDSRQSMIVDWPSKAADETNTLMVLSSSSMTRIEELRNQVPKGLFWMQTYLFKDKRVTLSNIRRAEAANFKALVVTIDSSGLGQNPVYSEYRWELEKLRESPNLRLVNYDNDFLVASPEDKLLTGYATEQINGSSSSLDDVKWLRSVTKLPIILKGILNSSVAKKAAESGLADGILVSAHGGRQLDGVPAPIEVLQEIVEAVRGTGVEVYMDGGIRTGTDILKALSLGARAVFLGRPVIWGLSVNGKDGVSHVLQILKQELTLAMKLCGISSLQDCNPSLLVHEGSYLPSNL